jgi:hypothetical protein
VQATVSPRVTLEAASQSAEVEVSADDLVRGYAESVVRYRVRSNDPRGFLLQIRRRSDCAELIGAQGLSQALAIGADGIDLYRPWEGGNQEITLYVRLRLDGMTMPGRVPMPVHVAVAAL